MLKLKVPAPLRAIGEMSKQNGTDKMTSEQIDEIIKEMRTAKRDSTKLIPE